MARLRCFSFSRSSLTDHGCDHYVTGCGEAKTWTWASREGRQVASQLCGLPPEHFQPFQASCGSTRGQVS